MAEDTKDVKLVLTKDEALVLFNLVGRLSKSENKNLYEHQSEERALWNLEALLEKELSESFDPNYKNIIRQAQERLKDKQ